MKQKIKNLTSVPDSSICNVINEFIDAMKAVTGENIEISVDSEGNCTMYYQSEVHPPIINKFFNEDNISYRDEHPRITVNGRCSRNLRKPNGSTNSNNGSLNEHKTGKL